MKTVRSTLTVVLGVLAVAVGSSAGGCSSSDSAPGNGSGASGANSPSTGGSGSPGGSGTSPVGGGSGAGNAGSGAGVSSGSASGTSGAPAGSSGSGATSSDDAGSSPTSGGDDGSAPASANDAGPGVGEGSVVSPDDASVAADVSATFVQRYEAEAVPPNVLVQSAIADHTCYGTRNTCPAGPLKEGANCCSGGGEVKQILGRVPCAPKDYQNCQKVGGGVEFHNVTVPADGTYDVTWWYHCGLNDFFGDKACGGVHYSVGTSCRPHLIDVNGAPISSSVGGQTALFFQFPCYPGAWATLHASTTALPLKAGANVITLHAPHEITLDAVDLDALEVLPKGTGAPPLVTPVVSGF